MWGFVCLFVWWMLDAGWGTGVGGWWLMVGWLVGWLVGWMVGWMNTKADFGGRCRSTRIIISR